MNCDIPFATITGDSGFIAEVLYVSPTFMRFGAPKRGNFADRRETRAERSAARQARRGDMTPRVRNDEFTRFFDPAS